MASGGASWNEPAKSQAGGLEPVRVTFAKPGARFGTVNVKEVPCWETMAADAETPACLNVTLLTHVNGVDIDVAITRVPGAAFEGEKLTELDCAPILDANKSSPETSAKSAHTKMSHLDVRSAVRGIRVRVRRVGFKAV